MRGCINILRENTNVSQVNNGEENVWKMKRLNMYTIHFLNNILCNKLDTYVLEPNFCWVFFSSFYILEIQGATCPSF